MLVFLLTKPSVAQYAAADTHQVYAKVFIAKVLGTDTTTLLKKEFDTGNQRMRNIAKVAYVKIKILSTISSDTKKKAAKGFIIIELERSEHNCSFDFKKGNTYRVYARVTKYSSPLLKKKYRQWHFHLDCRRQPELLP